MGGAVTYLTSLLQHLPRSESGHEFLVFLPPQTAALQKDFAPNIKLFPTGVGNGPAWRRLWWDQITLRRFLKREQAHVLFSTADFGLPFCPVRQVLLVRNAIYFSRTYEERFVARDGVKAKASFRLRRWLACRSARWADVVMTPTEAMLTLLRDHVELPASKVLVNPYGVSRLAGSLAGTPERQERANSPAEPVVLLYPSLYGVHKNLGTLLKALALLNGNGTPGFRLRTTADPNWANWAATFQEDVALAQSPAVAPWLEFMSPRSWDRSLEAYRHADIFVFPSLVESFGHPLVEAMAAGLPVVAADTPVNREICSEAAVYFSPLNPVDLAHQVRQLAADRALRGRLGAAGRERVAARFRWEEHVHRLLEGAQAMPPDAVTGGRGALDSASTGPPARPMEKDRVGLSLISRVRAFNAKLNDLFFPPGTPSYVLRFRELAADLGARAEVALHLGAGSVNLESFVTSLASRPRLLTLDLSLEALRENTGSRRVCGDAEALPLPSRSVDLIVAEHVFEHFPRPEVCLRECHRVLKEGGRLVASGPNGLSYISLLARLTPLGFHRWVHRVASGNGKAQVFPTLYRFSSPRVIHRLAAEAGFEITSLERFVGEPCYTGALPILHLAFVAYHLALEKLRPFFGFHITSVAVLRKPLLDARKA